MPFMQIWDIRHGAIYYVILLMVAINNNKKFNENRKDLMIKMNENERKIKLLTIRQAAKIIYGLTEYRIRQLCRSGEMPCIKAGKKYLVNEQTLIGFVSMMDKRNMGDI